MPDQPAESAQGEPNLSDAATPAEQLLAAFLERQSAGEEVDIEALCAEHRQHARDLRRLHAIWQELQGVLEEMRSGPSAEGSKESSERGASRSVPPRNTPPTEPGFAEILRRLASRKETVDRYRVESQLAQGGMGAVLRVWDEELGRFLAMKVLLGRVPAREGGDTPAADARKLARFLEEARVTSQLDHPGILPVHELGLDADGRAYFTMKLVKGRDLKAIFDLAFEEKEGWSETRVVGVLLKVCEALAYAHSKGVIHRDLKPANVMVGSFGEVYVMDWGLARIAGRDDAHDIRLKPDADSPTGDGEGARPSGRESSGVVTRDGDVIGTPAYMPPEQARGEVEKVSPRSDVYAVGAMLYHLLARQMPYASAEAGRSGRAVLARVAAGPPRALHDVNPSTPVELAAICEKAMARDPARRYADTLALAEDLRAYLEHRVVGAHETGAVPELRKWIARNKPLAAASAAAILILAIGLVVSASLSVKARQETARAQANERFAKDQELVATRRANEVLSLSAIQELEELVEQADALWPVRAERIPAYDAWLGKARVLLEGLPADRDLGREAHPGLKDHEARLAQIRKRAAPLTPEQVDADWRASPSFAELEEARAQLVWTRRMLGEEPWPNEAEVEAALSRESLPADSVGLNALVWPEVGEDRAKPTYGGEIRMLLLARRALAAASAGQRGETRNTLAWALFRCGRLDDALAEGLRAVEDVPPGLRDVAFGSLNRLHDKVEFWKPGPAESGRGEPSPREQETARLALRIRELERAVDERRTYEFDDAQDRWWHAQLAQLVADLKAFEDATTGLCSEGTSPVHGWGIARRRREAATIEERSIGCPEARRRWEETTAAVGANARYGSLALTPQLGLLPIGEDPDSHLREFAHLMTGEPPRRGPDGKLELEEGTGLVLVLIPGGTFRMGAQRLDPTEANYDPMANADEWPVSEVTLEPYFLSKYEMTQGQWLRLLGRNPSHFSRAYWLTSFNREGREPNELLPVENVTWTDCRTALNHVSLDLPTEAQWERAARGGTESSWWTGDEPDSLAGAANLADVYGREHGGNHWPAWEKEINDGNTVTVHVGSYRANPFGLHDVAGNVLEWCRDDYVNYRFPARAGDGERTSDTPGRVIRGGCFDDVAPRVRSSMRMTCTSEHRSLGVGLRPARELAMR